MIYDGQNVIAHDPAKNKFQVRELNVAFHYHRNKMGRLKQCNVFAILSLPDSSKFMVVSYTRPHVLDKDKITKIGGRSIAAARLAKFLDLIVGGKNEQAQKIKGIRVYSCDPSVTQRYQYAFRKDGKVIDGWVEGPEFSLQSLPTENINQRTGKISAARCEKIPGHLLARMFHKLS